MSRIFGENHYTTGGVAGVRKMSNLWTKRAFAGLTYSRLIVAGLALVAVLASPAHAQNDRMTPIATPSQPNAVELGTGPLPDAKNPESWHSQYGSQFARNVTVATLTPFLPDPAKASGAAVVVAPGGGFRTLSMENEGWNVARSLAEKGVAAFVLKYRLNQTPADMPGFERSMREMFSGQRDRHAPILRRQWLVLLRRSQTPAQRLHLSGNVLPSGTSIRTGSAWLVFPPARC